MIFASTIDGLDNALFDALMSRVPCFNFDLSDEEIKVQMRRIAAQGWRKDDGADSPRLTPTESGEVTEFLVEECRRNSIRIDLRHQVKAYGLYVQHRAGLAETHWKDLIRILLAQRAVSLANTPAPASAHRKLTKAEQQAIAVKVRADYPTPEQRLAAWAAETAMAPRTYYRRLEELPLIV